MTRGLVSPSGLRHELQLVAYKPELIKTTGQSLVLNPHGCDLSLFLDFYTLGMLQC